jgi:hypothetical protein
MQLLGEKGDVAAQGTLLHSLHRPDVFEESIHLKSSEPQVIACALGRPVAQSPRGATTPNF